MNDFFIFIFCRIAPLICILICILSVCFMHLCTFHVTKKKNYFSLFLLVWQKNFEKSKPVEYSLFHCSQCWEWKIVFPMEHWIFFSPFWSFDSSASLHLLAVSKMQAFVRFFLYFEFIIRITRLYIEPEVEIWYADLLYL